MKHAADDVAEATHPSRRGWVALRGTLVTATATLGSRVLGFVRDALMVAYVGITPANGAFTLAWVVPNLFRRIFGEGAVSAAILPTLARVEREQGLEATRRVFARFQAVFLLGLIALVIVGETVVVVARALTKDPDTREALQLTACLLPYVLPICMTALAAAPQHLGGRFSLPALAPAVLNLIWISVLLLLVATQGFDPALPALIWLAAGIVAGGLMQWLMQFPGLRASGFRIRPQLRAGDGTVRRALRDFAPAVLGLAVVQLNFAVDQILVRWLVDPALNTYTHLANRLLQLPLALVAVSAATGAQPLFARLAAEHDLAGLGRTLRQTCEWTLVVILAAAGGLYVVAEPTIAVLFEHGRFTAEHTVALSAVLRAYLWCLPGAALCGLLARARQSLGDYRGPARLAAAVVPVNLVLNLLLLPWLGVPGAGYATAAAVNLQAVCLAWGLGPRWGLEAPVRLRRLLRIGLPATFSVAAAMGVRALFGMDDHSLPGLMIAITAGLSAAAVGVGMGLREECRNWIAAFRKSRKGS